MKRVYKYTIIPDDYVTLSLPKNAQILSVAEQGSEVGLWALVDTQAELEVRRFRFAGTGHPIKESSDRLRHVSTFPMRNGQLIFHFFEVLP